MARRAAFALLLALVFGVLGSVFRAEKPFDPTSIRIVPLDRGQIRSFEEAVERNARAQAEAAQRVRQEIQRRRAEAERQKRSRQPRQE